MTGSFGTVGIGFGADAFCCGRINSFGTWTGVVGVVRDDVGVRIGVGTWLCGVAWVKDTIRADVDARATIGVDDNIDSLDKAFLSS